ncbi:MAG: glycosyltransferase family 39 protein [Pyrinomonadaceae bacterium]
MAIKTLLRSLLTVHGGCLTILVLASILFFVNIGSYNRFSRAESYFSLGSRMMLETGDRLLMHSPQELPLNKPPLEYWVIGASYKIFGTDYGSGRIPSGLFALGILALTYAFGQRFIGRLGAATAAAMLATTWLFFSFARLTMPDILLTLCIMTSICCWMLVLDGISKHQYLLALIGYAAMAAGFLVKGPAAIFLTGAPFLIELIISRDLSIIRKLRPFSGLIVFLLFALPYFVLVYLRDGMGPIENWFVQENLRRFTGTSYAPRSSFIEYTFGSMLGGFAPWSILLLIVAFFDLRKRKALDIGHRTVRLLYIWMILPVAFFAASRFRIDYYVIPAFPAAALITARIITQIHLSTVTVQRILYVFSTMVVLGLLVAAGFLAIAPLGVLFPETSLVYLCAFAIICGLIPTLVCIYLRKVNYLVLGTTFAIWLTLVSINIFLTPQQSRFLPVPQMSAKVTDTAKIYVYGDAEDWTPDIRFNLPYEKPVLAVPREMGVARVKELLDEANTAVFLYEDDLLALQNLGFAPAALAEGEVYQARRINVKMLLNPQLRKLYCVSKSS